MEYSIDKIIVFPPELYVEKKAGESSYYPIRRILATKTILPNGEYSKVPLDIIYIDSRCRSKEGVCTFFRSDDNIDSDDNINTSELHVQALVPVDLINKIKEAIHPSIITNIHKDDSSDIWMDLEVIDEDIGAIHGMHSRIFEMLQDDEPIPHPVDMKVGIIGYNLRLVEHCCHKDNSCMCNGRYSLSHYKLQMFAVQFPGAMQMLSL